REVIRRLELVELLLEQQRVGAQVDEPLALEEAARDVGDLRVQERLAAGDADNRRPALVRRSDALRHREMPLEQRRRVLDLSAAGATQIAPEQRLQHQHEGVALPSRDPLLQYVAGHGEYLGDRNTHVSPAQ